MFFPIKDLNPAERFPVITIAIIAVNILVFVYELSLGRELEGFVAAYGAVPYEITRGVDLVGRVGGLPVVHTEGPRFLYVTLITSMFIHGGFLHILGNMVFLWVFGDNIESLLGHARFLLFYLVCGVIAALAHVFTQPNAVVPTIGASGAVAGVLGGYLIAYPRARVLTLLFLGIFIRMIVLPASVLLVFWFVLQMFSGFASLSTGAGGGVAWFAHIGGFIAGALLVKLMVGRKLRWQRDHSWWK